MNTEKKALLVNLLSIITIIILLNIDHLIFSKTEYLLAFRASYILFFLLQFVISIFRGKQISSISKIFEPIVKRFTEFPKNYQYFIAISILIGLTIFFCTFVFIIIYVY